MLKIHKGLKKKKKDKKHKRDTDNDLFDEAELERYRKEHQRPLDHSDSDKRIAGDSSHENDRSSSNVSRDDDEWKKFQALTAGVDTILQKTQEDLDRIKSTSFFQRKPVTSTSTSPAVNHDDDDDKPSETDVAKGAERVTGQKSTLKGSIRVDDHECGNDDDVNEKTKLSKTLARTERRKKEKELEFDDLEEQFTDPENVTDDDELDDVVNNVDDDSIFNTSYVDAATSGDLKLAYIPDSPTDEVDNDYDPFDTSIADKFVISNPKKRYLNLGCAVEVLSGQIEKAKAATTAALPTSTKRRIVKPVELLLSSFDEAEGAESVNFGTTEDKSISSVPPIESPVKTLLDEDLVFTPAEACYPLTTTLFPPAKTPESNTANPSLEQNCAPSVSTLPSTPVEVFLKNNSVDSVDDEFAQLAAESLTKNLTAAEPAPSTTVLNPLDRQFHTFETPKTVIANESDPFNTPAAATTDTQPLEKQQSLAKVPQTAQLLAAIEDDDFDPRATSTSGNCEERFESVPADEIFKAEFPASQQFNEILSPITIDEDTAFEDDIDPFDTSYVNGLPGSAELKLIEKELIESE